MGNYYDDDELLYETLKRMLHIKKRDRTTG